MASDQREVIYIVTFCMKEYSLLFALGVFKKKEEAIAFTKSSLLSLNDQKRYPVEFFQGCILILEHKTYMVKKNDYMIS